MKSLAFASLLLLAGCTTYDTPYHAKSVAAEPSHNFFGIVTTEPASYGYNAGTKINLSTTEISARRNTTGDRITLLWGAITISDY
ncbi:MAG: hypothetical protein ACKOLZ_05650 [Verrucomicrobiota bacterium]|jgi:hypothetical protein